MSPHELKVAKLHKAYEEQIAWMQDRGGDLKGYRAYYGHGSTTDAIYKADRMAKAMAKSRIQKFMVEMEPEQEPKGDDKQEQMSLGF